MTQSMIIIAAMLIPLFALAIIAIVLLVSKNKPVSAEQQELNRLQLLLPKTKVNNRRDWAEITAKAYPYLREIPFIRDLQNRLQRRLGIIYAGDDTLVRTKSSGYTVLLIVASILIMIVALILSDQWTTRLAIIGATVFISGILFDVFVESSELSVLREEDEMIQNIRHEYQITNMVNESLERVAEESKSKIISTHAEKIAEIMDADDPESELYAYYDVAPNRHMKQLAGISFKVAEYGDSSVASGEESFYLSALSNIREEILLDVDRRVKLKRLLSGLVFVAVTPIFAVDPIRRWAESSFPILSNYYNSAWGMYSLVLMYVIFIVAYIVLRFAKKVEADTQAVKDEGKWLEKLLNIRWVGKVVDRVVPETHQAQHFKVSQDLKRANSKLNVRSFYLWKVCFLVTIFISMIILQVSVHVATKDAILHPNQNIRLNGQTSGQQLLTRERYEFEALLIGEIISKDIGPDQIIPYIVERSKNKVFIDVNQDINEYASELAERVIQYKNNYYKWYELIVAFVIALIAYNIPNIYLMIKKRVRKWERQNEVDGFNNSIMMLSNIPSISVYEILEWLHRDSYIFQEQLMNCLLDYESGAWDALETMKDEAHFQPLERLMERLQEAADRIPIKQAFDDMAIERNKMLKEREEHYATMISAKVTYGKAAGFTPFVATVVLYLLCPIMFTMFQQVGELTTITGGLGS